MTKQEEANVPGHAPFLFPLLYTMRMNSAPGKHAFGIGCRRIMRLNGRGGARLCAPEPGAGDAMEGALDDADRVAGASGWEVAHGGLPLDTLWHGMELSAAEVFEGKPTYDTISLVRDTKHINVSLREIDDPTQMDVANYDFRIIDRNARILWDNSLDEAEQVAYTPYAAWNTDDRIPATDAEGNDLGQPGHIAHVEFMTSRILYHEDAATTASCR